MAFKITKNEDKDISILDTITPTVQSDITAAKSAEERDTDEFYELEPAEVIDIILDSSHPEFQAQGGWNSIGKIKARLHQSEVNRAEKDLNWIKPYCSNDRFFPLRYEHVLVGNFPKAQSSGSVTATDAYYLTNPINLFNNINENAIPNLSLSKNKLRKIDSVNEKLDSYEDSQTGNTENISDSNKNKIFELGNTFILNNNIKPLQPFEGDRIIEGRFGNSIRFGSTVKEKGVGQKRTWWSEIDKNGDPIIIIRNGQNDENNTLEPNQFCIEDIDKDYSSMYFTSTQLIPFTKSHDNQKSWNGKEPKAQDYKGKQLFLATDRFIFNAKNEDFLAFTKKSFGFSAKDSFRVDAEKEVHLNGKRVLCGLNADRDGEPVVLGKSLVNALRNMIRAITYLQYNGPLIKGSDGPLQKVSAQLDEILSEITYTLKK